MFVYYMPMCNLLILLILTAKIPTISNGNKIILTIFF